MIGHPTALRRPSMAPAAPPPVSQPARQNAPAPASDLLTPAVVADLLQVNTKVLERWRGAGDGPSFVRLTRKTIRYRLRDVEAFISARLRASTADA